MPRLPRLALAAPLIAKATNGAASANETSETIDLITLELDNLQRAAQESLAEQTVSKTSRDLDTLEKAAQDKLAGGSEAKEEPNTLDQVVQQLMAEAAQLSPVPSGPT